VAPLAIGLSLFVAASATGHWTGGSLNPARYLGANATGDCGDNKFAYAGSYIGGELLGAVLAAFIHWYVMLCARMKQRSEPTPFPPPGCARSFAKCTAFAAGRPPR